MFKQIGVSFLFIALCEVGISQEWVYNSIDVKTGKPSYAGAFKLTEPVPGKYKGRLMFANPDSCWRNDLNASVEDLPEKQVITLEPLMRGCEEIRLVINRDGSGGRRELRVSESEWKWDGYDRGLQRK